MRAQPTAEQRPKALKGVDVNFVKAIAILIPSIFTWSVVDSFVVIASLG